MVLLQVFPNNRNTYVSDQIIDPETVPNETSQFLIPIDRSQVILSSLKFDQNVMLKTDTSIEVIKGDSTYTGNLVFKNDNIVTISNQGQNQTIRDYDEITESTYFVGELQDGSIPSTLTASYLTNGIVGSIVHSIDLDTKEFESSLNLNNNTSTDFENAEIDVVTTEQPNIPMYRMATDFVQNSAPMPSQTFTPTGTVYNILEPVNVESGYNSIIPIFSDTLDIKSTYVIDAPNGKQKATLTLEWLNPTDLPAGEIYVYSGGKLQSNTNIQSLSKGNMESLPIVVVANVFATGTITRVNVSESKDASQQQEEITLSGTITNSLQQDIDVDLRYFIGDSKFELVSEQVDMMRDSQYLIFPFTISSGQKQPYQIQFIKTQ